MAKRSAALVVPGHHDLAIRLDGNGCRFLLFRERGLSDAAAAEGRIEAAIGLEAGEIDVADPSAVHAGEANHDAIVGLNGDRGPKPSGPRGWPASRIRRRRRRRDRDCHSGCSATITSPTVNWRPRRSCRHADWCWHRSPSQADRSA